MADNDYAREGERPADSGGNSCDWTLPGAHDRAVVTDMSHTSRSRRAVTLPELRAPMNALKERLDVAAGEDTSHILSGLTNQLPDRDPEETAE
ncbi:hypothetical protein, partial [Arthrobacter sp. UYEF20]|uniref:hypothetical protein n=1 Tax=Arthrobacter sp. UYEF20 TaxID=1756363 RepID=UPI0033923BFF